MTSTTAQQKWKAAYGKLRSIANDEKSGKIQAVLMGHSLTVYSAFYRTDHRLAGLESDAARRAKYIDEAARLTRVAAGPSFEHSMQRWNKQRAQAHINLARENASSLPTADHAYDRSREVA